MEKEFVPRTVSGWAHWPSDGLALLQSGWDDLRGKIEVVPQKLNPIVGQIPVIMHPSEGLANVLLRLEALHKLDHLQIRDIDFRVLRKVIVLLREANALWISKKFE